MINNFVRKLCFICNYTLKGAKLSTFLHNLRQLCFAKLPSNEKEKYPNYLGLDLYSTKYSSRWIYSFLEIDDFERILEIIHQNSTKDYTEAVKTENSLLYLK